MPTAFKEGVCLPRRICYGQRSDIVLNNTYDEIICNGLQLRTDFYTGER